MLNNGSREAGNNIYMKKVMKEFIPPIILKMLSLNSRRIFSNYHDALKLCTTNAYEENELIEVILKKTKIFSSKLNSEISIISETSAYSLLSMINPIIDNKANEINVLDFGGSCGGHYFQIRSLLNKDFKLNWAVIETPTMVKYAKELETNELFFVDNFEDAINELGKIDLLHTSGTLQCVDNPEKYLDKILNCNAKWILFNRLGLNELDRNVITIHSSKLSWNGIGELPEGHTDRWVKYPFNFMSEAKFLKALEERYSIIIKFNDLSGMYPVSGEKIVGYGLLCKRKDL